MQVDHFLNFRRLFLFMRKTIYENYLMILITFGAISILVLASALSMNTENNNHIDGFHMFHYFLLLFLSGLIFTAVIFNDMQDKQRGYACLTLPVSGLEKFLSSFLLTSFACILGSFILYFILSIIVRQIIYYWGSKYLPVFDPFQRDIWINLYRYFVFHAVVLFSAAYFKKATLLKLPVALLGLAVIFGLFMLISTRIVYWEFFNGLFNPIREKMYVESAPVLQDFIIEYLWPIIEFSFWFILPPFLWLLTYLRLKEKQV